MNLDPTSDIPRRSLLFRLTGRERTNSGRPCQGVRRQVHENVNPEVDSARSNIVQPDLGKNNEI